MNLIVHLSVLAPVFFIAVSFLIPVLNHYKFEKIGLLSLIFAGWGTGSSLVLVYHVMTRGPIRYYFGSWEPPWGIEFMIGRFEVLMLLLVTLLYLLVIIYTRSFIQEEIKPKVVHWYYILLFLLEASLIGMIATNDLFNFFVFLEICAIGSVAIISVKDDRDSIEASIKYLFLNSIGSAFVLFAIGLIYMVTGHLNIPYAGESMVQAAALFPRTVNMSLVFMFLGLALKAALFPLHIWLPDAYTSAPHHSTVILAGLVGKAYIIGLVKILFKVYNIEILQSSNLLSLILFLSVLAIIIGSIFAIGQKKVKRMLAYSSVAQVGYIFLGVGLLTESGLTGGLLHIFNHALIKSLLFLAAGVIIYKTGIEDLEDFQGVGYRFPLTMIFFSLGALAMVGIPPLNGFMSKWFLAVGTLQADKPFLLGVILLSSFMNGIYYLPIIIRSFFSSGTEKVRYEWEFSRLDKKVWVPMMFIAAALIVSGIFPNIPLYFINKIVTELLVL